MSTEENKALARRFLEDVFNRGNLDLIDELIPSDTVDHNPLPGQPPGSAGVKWVVRLFREAFPDLHFALEDQVAEGDTVASRWTFSGTQQGPLFGIPATGKRVSVSGIDVVRIAAGKMTEHWVAMDQLGMLQQLGAVPTPGG